MSVGSRLYVKGGVEYNGKNLHTVNLNMLNEGDTVYNITGNIIKEAGKSTVKENSDGKSFGLSISHDTFDSAGKIQNVLKPSNGTVTAGIGRGKSESQGEYYSHNQDITKGTTYYNNSPDVKIRGVDVQTGGIAGKVASLTVESVQDRTDGKSSGYNISYGIGIGEHAVMRNGTKEMADGLHTTNIGVGYSRGKHTERTTNAIGGFTAEHGVLDVIGKTVQTGSVIGGGFTLNTGTYEKNDLEDVNKRKNVGINLTFTPGVTDVYRNGRLTPDSVGGVLVGTRIDYSKDDYVAKVKATIGNSVNMTVAGKKADFSGVNRDTSNMVDVLKDKKINPVSIDLGTEYWATNYGREKTKGDFTKAGNKIERVVEIIKAVSENEGKDIGLYYRDRLDFEAERDRKERSGELETILIDRDKALEMAERAAGRKIDDLQIISTKDPNIKEIVGADAIAGRAYHVGNGKIVIVADNIGDYAKAMGTIAEEGRHIYHRKNNGLEDSEDYASFYGRQFERYYDRNFGNNDVAFITERLKYTKEQLGNDWENKKIVDQFKANVTKYFKTEEQRKKVHQAFREAYGQDFYVDWKRYATDRGNYTGRINYYYLQALNSVKSIEEFNRNRAGYGDEITGKEAVFHNFINGKIYIGENANKKYVNFENGKEVVLNSSLTKIIKDPVNVGTFNYYTYRNDSKKWSDTRDKGYHFADIINWIAFGSGINDKSSVSERVDRFVLGTLVSMQYKGIKDWASDKRYETIGYKELSEYDSRNAGRYKKMKQDIESQLKKR